MTGRVGLGCTWLFLVAFVGGVLTGAVAMTARTVTRITAPKVEGTFVAQSAQVRGGDQDTCDGRFLVAGDPVPGTFTLSDCSSPGARIDAVRIGDSQDLEHPGPGPYVADALATVFADGCPIALAWIVWCGARRSRRGAERGAQVR